ncbi:hypothetical protein PSTG_13838 [Puccinia striiformis f. sp. tritici PST-78]|uniref:HAT C-terminal dimerisation domain-containing protein n=1 Tax=Puccinia striiformis f. sp. tritici PST-78 TaxID=1165861 RepID=A0A0L0V0R6_9BASI|nr:hypothetical protein PSTG_13838 [Puccinia striiformis f. sp. tritici PST-78]
MVWIDTDSTSNAHVIQAHEGALYLGVDAWQSPNGYDIVGAVIYRLLDDGVSKAKLEAMPLDFVQLKERHTGEYLARMVKYIVEKFGIENRICGIVSDNAANNGTMIAELEKLDWKRFKGEPQWIRCFAHILNLIVKAILRPFARLKNNTTGATDLDDSDEDDEEGDLIERFNEEEENSDVDDDEEEIGDIPAAANGELAEDDELTLADIEDLDDEDDNDAYTSDLFPSNCDQTSEVSELEGKVHSDFIVRCEDAVIMWQRDKQFGTPRNHHVKQEDFDLAADLVKVLQPFYKLTLQLSIKASARVAEVVVMIDQITAGLSAVIANEEERYPPALRNACPMVLHPSFKDEYFKLAKWPNDWINEAINLTREMFDKWYKPRNSTSAPRPSKKGPPKPQTGVLAGLGAAAVARSAESSSDPVDIWLAGGLYLDEGQPINGLKWWADQKRSGNTHHGLLQMALDVMCCPATTVDVERTFSFGRDYVSLRRHNLHAKSVSRGMALAFYSKNNKIKPLALHKYMEKRKDETKTRLKQARGTVGTVVTIE